MSYEAFITGSRKYGEPGPKSDIDIVLFMDPADMQILADYYGDEGLDEQTPVCYGGQTLVIRDGSLNLLVFSDEAKYHAWRRGTAACVKQKPVTRVQAVQTISYYLRSPWERIKNWARIRRATRKAA